LLSFDKDKLANWAFNCVGLARAAVHFNAICESFTHNTTFEISDAKDLKDSKLSAACSLHAASGSSSSSTSSLRRRRLNEIAEAEEEQDEERERKRQSVVKEEERPASSIYSDPPLSPLSPEPPVVLDHQQITNPRETTFASTTNVPDFMGANVPLSPTRTDGRRLSSQSARHEVYSSASYNYGRPKVKLGPRPSLDAHKKPSTAENFRPVAALPAGFKFFKGSMKGKSQEQAQGEQLDHTSPATEPITELLQHSFDDQLPPRPATSSGASIKSIASSMAPPREAKITHEKARLIKAMKLREKKMQSAKSQPLSPTNDKPESENFAGAAANAESEMPFSIQGESTSCASTNADSANDLPTSAFIKSDPHSGENVLDSHPSSPGAASSTGICDSTKASSLSESTDETIEASKNPAQNTVEDTKADVVGLSDIVEETGFQASTTDIQKKNPAEHALQPENIDTNVLRSKVTKCGEEFARIPGSDETQATEAMIRESIEPNDSLPSADSRAALHESKNLDAAQNYNAASGLQAIENSILGSDSAMINTTVLPPTVYKPHVDPGGEQSVPAESLGVRQSASSSNEPKSPISPLLPTTPSLKSKFSRKDVAIPTGPTPTTIGKTVSASLIGENGLSEPAALSQTNPEITLASPPTSTRHKTAVQPILTNLPAKTSSHFGPDDPLDDDALMDELQTATVQEAKPVLVSKSPITPVFPSSPTKDARFPRAVSNPMRGSLLMPGDMSQNTTGRNVSSGGGTSPNNITRQPSNASIQSKKSNVGSTISQRIKALQALSGNATEENRPRPITPSATFFTVRKPSTREPSKSPSVADRATSLTRHSPPPEPSRETTPEAPNYKRERSGSIASKLTMFEGQNAPRGRPESIQVTARIIRGSRSPFSKSPNPSKQPRDTAPLELRQSTLLVDVQRAQSVRAEPLSDRIPVADRPKTSVQESQATKPASDSVEKKARRRSSISLMKDFIKEHTPLNNKSTENLADASPGAASVKSPGRPPSVHQNSGSFARRLSTTSSRRSSITREGDNASISGATSSADDDKSLSDKKTKNRASRFMRRLSNSFGGARKSGSASISPTVTEEDADQLEKAAVLAAQVSSPTIVTFMGDVNVQFPDNLLWKRRSMCLDAQGFLFLSTVHGAAKKGKESAGTKRYHLSDFRKPYIPDVEVEELPNSVVLDFLEGSCLQIACGDRVGQQNTLRSKSSCVFIPSIFSTCRTN
jgi:hypothetical protein